MSVVLMTACVWIGIAVASIGPMGCGGSGSKSDGGLSTLSTAPKSFGRATVSITFPAQSRLIPDAAQSIMVRLMQGTTVLATKTIVRPSGGGTVTAGFDSLPIGTVIATSTAYPNSDGTGTAQATASTAVEIATGAVTPFSVTMGSTITDILIDPATVKLTIGQTQALIATPKDASGSTVLVGSANITWGSSNPAAATVSASGVVTAVATGVSTLTATESESGKSSSISVTVVAPSPSPSPSPTVSPSPTPSPSPSVGPPSTTAPQFTLGATYSVPKAGEEIITGDFDSDGKADVVIGGPASLQIFYGRGDGTLEAPVSIDPSTTLGARYAADVNNDGRLDLLCGDDNGVYLFLNNGGRSFSLPIRRNVGFIRSAVTIPFAGQLNKEIAVTVKNNDFTGSVRLLRLEGNTLQDVATYSVPQQPTYLDAGDLTNDGIPDLAVGFVTSIVDQSGAMVFPGRTDGTFGAGTRYNTATQNPEGVEINDFNADGRPDLALAHYFDYNIGILLNTGGTIGATLEPPLRYHVDSTPRCNHSADFNRDGWRDIVTVGAGTTFVQVLWNRGTTFTNINVPTGGRLNRSVNVADFNGDGKTDIITSNEDSGTISILLNTTP